MEEAQTVGQAIITCLLLLGLFYCPATSPQISSEGNLQGVLPQRIHVPAFQMFYFFKHTNRCLFILMR